MNLDKETNGSYATPEEMLSQAERDAIATEASTDSLAVRNYSKRENAQKRSELAAELRDLRTEYLSQRAENRARINELETEVEAGTLGIAKAERIISRAERMIEYDSAGFFRRLMNNKDIKRSQRMIVSYKSRIEEMTQRLAEANNSLLHLHELASDRSLLSDLRGRIEAFYQQQGNEYEKAEITRQIDLRKKVDVVNIIREYEVTFVHGVYVYTPEDNSTIYEDTPVETKFEIALSLAPHISASTVKPGQRKSMLCGYGLLVNGGEVTSASGRDSASQPIRLLDRGTVNNEEMPSRESVVGEIYDAIHAKRNSAHNRLNYNELTVNRPRFAGIYWSSDFADEHGIGLEKFKPFKDIVEIAERMGAPIFILKEGKLFRAVIVKQPTDRGLNVYPTNLIEITPEEYASLPDCISDDQREALKERVLTEIPFKIEAIKSPEARMVASICDGRSTYFRSAKFDDSSTFSEINPSKYYFFSAPEGTTHEYRKWTQQEIRENIKVVGKVENVGKVTTFFKRIDERHENPTNGENWFSGRILEETHIWGRPQSDEGSFEFVGKITLAGHYEVREDAQSGIKKSFDVHSYIEYMAKLLEDGFVVHGLDEDEARLNIAGHIFGFGLQAQEFGDEETAKQCFELASKVTDLGQLQTLVDERKGTGGRLKLKESDLTS